LAEVVDASDLIVRGTVSRVFLGVPWVPEEGEPGFDVAWMTIEIEEVLKGVPHSRVQGTVDVRLLPVGDAFEDMQQNVPAHENIFFLLNDAAEHRRNDEPPVDRENDRYSYHRPNAYQTVIRNIAGRVSVILPQQAELFEPGTFPYPLEGASFEAFVEDVRRLAASVGKLLLR
jgi:hypothetical protein